MLIEFIPLFLLCLEVFLFSRMKSEPYEVLVRDLIKSAKVLDHSKDPCAEDFIPQDQVGYTCIFF